MFFKKKWEALCEVVSYGHFDESIVFPPKFIDTCNKNNNISQFITEVASK